MFLDHDANVHRQSRTSALYANDSLKISLENITEEVQRGVAIAESMTLRTAGFRRVV